MNFQMMSSEFFAGIITSVAALVILISFISLVVIGCKAAINRKKK